MDDVPQSVGASASGLFREGDLALLISRKGRRHLLQLDAAKLFETHTGILPHSGIIGQEVGSRLLVGGQKFLALRPTLAEYVQEAARSTQIIYPKDVGPILVYGDVFPGARILEAGLGSGMLTLALLRAVVMKPVWATIRCWGRTLRRDTNQGRSMTSKVSTRSKFWCSSSAPTSR